MESVLCSTTYSLIEEKNIHKSLDPQVHHQGTETNAAGTPSTMPAHRSTTASLVPFVPEVSERRGACNGVLGVGNDSAFSLWLVTKHTNSNLCSRLRWSGWTVEWSITTTILLTERTAVESKQTKIPSAAVTLQNWISVQKRKWLDCSGFSRK